MRDAERQGARRPEDPEDALRPQGRELRARPAAAAAVAAAVAAAAIVTYDYAPHAHFLNLPQRTAPPVVPPLPRSAAQNEAAWAAAAAARAPQAAAA